MTSPFLLLPLLHITTCAVYTVTPDDHYYPNTTCHHCHNLQHYLLNVTKYFTSDTQLLFLPGLHHLHTDLIIQNVHNISLISSKTSDTTPTTVITINATFISVINVSRLMISNILINALPYHHYQAQKVPLTIKDCSEVLLYHLTVDNSRHPFALVWHYCKLILSNTNSRHSNRHLISAQAPYPHLLRDYQNYF